MLSITNDGRNAALDLKLIDPTALVDDEVLQQAGAVTATRFGPKQRFEVVTLP